MLEVKKASLALCAAMALFVLTGFAPKRAQAPLNGGGEPDPIVSHISLLRLGSPQQKAAAAYWLGQQRTAAAEAVSSLVELLGDATQVDPTRYRPRRMDKMTLGEEAAAALVNIGHPSIEPLIRVLKSSPQVEARKNAAWALGALHDTGATTSDI
jgi:HEAT repeat protein